MSLSEEYRLRRLLTDALFFYERREENESFLPQCKANIEEVDKTLQLNIRSSFEKISYESFILFAETAISIPGKEDRAEEYLEKFFQRNTSRGQIYIRALLCYARVIAFQGFDYSLKAEENIKNLQKALDYVVQAIEIISKPENKFKYSYLIYNASVCVYHIIRPMLRPQWQRNFIDVVDKIQKMLSEVEEPDISWLCRFTWVLFHCVYDVDPKKGAIIFQGLWDLTVKKGECDFQDNLFRLKIHLSNDNSTFGTQAKKDADNAHSNKGWRHLFTLQSIKSGLIKDNYESVLMKLLESISPAIVNGNDLPPNSTNITPVMQERLAESARVAVTYGVTNVAELAINFLSKVRQPSQKAYILLEYAKAEYLVKTPGPVLDSKTNTRLNSAQIKRQEIERRSEALKILWKVMATNKKVNDPDLIYEGAVLIWNLSLPFMNANHKSHTYHPFLAACSLLEMIQSTDVQLRVNMHLELAKYEIDEDLLQKAEINIAKALALDYSITVQKIPVKYNPDEELGLYQRPFDRYLYMLRDRVNLKLNPWSEIQNELDRIIMDLEQNSGTTNENARFGILQTCLSKLVSLEEATYVYNPEDDLVEEEIKKDSLEHEQRRLYLYKQKKLIAGEVCKQAFDWELPDIAVRAAAFVLSDKWEPKNSSEMILNQAECCYIFSLCRIDQLYKDNFEIAFIDPIRVIEEDHEIEDKPSQKKLEQVLLWKNEIVDNFIRGLKLSESIGQSWLIFNGAVYIWNGYLQTFRNPSNDSKLLPRILDLLREFFESMKNYNKELEKKNVFDYDLESKILVYANIGIIYARLLEFKNLYDEVVKACEALLLSPLNPHTRKLINSIKARTSNMAKSSGKTQSIEKGGKAGQSQSQVQNNDQLLFDVVSQLEIIQNNTIKADAPILINKCYDTLKSWKANENDETELELHAELWARLAKLSLKEGNVTMYKFALKSVENSLALLNPNADLTKLPVSRLRWYSMAEYLYAETLSHMINPQTQEKESQERLLFHALKHSIEAANKGSKADISILVLDAARQFWNLCSKLKDSASARKAMIKPIYTMIYYLKSVKEDSEPDLVLLLNRLLTQAAYENNEFKLGESGADMAFELVPKQLQKTLWESKMIFLSKQGKNELQAINNMKDADNSLQAKLWMRLARTAVNINKQFSAYQKAIDLLKKDESVEIVDVLMEFSEWLLRNGYDYRKIVDNLVHATDILIEIEQDPGEDDEEAANDEKKVNIFSRAQRDKKPYLSKLIQTKSSARGQNNLAGIKAGQRPKKAQDQKNLLGKMKIGSRLSKAAYKGATTTKTKASKSMFTEKEDEGNPENLNISHYDKLVRMHALLAMIAKTNEETLQYCLDAKFFLCKILALSYSTLNSIEQRDAKLNQISKEKEDKNKPKESKPQDLEDTEVKFNLPEKLEEWIGYQIPKELIEKIKAPENSTNLNIMSKIVFEKAELTYFCLEYILKTFQSLGHHLQCLEIYSFLRFFVKEIIVYPLQIAALIEVKYSRFLCSIGLIHEGRTLYQNISLVKFFPNEIEKKTLLTKAESSVVQQKGSMIVENMSDKNKRPQFVIKEIQIHQLWIQLAEELLYFGEFSKAKQLFNNAYSHAKTLNDIENLGLIELFKGKISYYEGRYTEALETYLRGFEYPKEVGNWAKYLVKAFKVLWRLSKHEDLEKMISKMDEIINEYFF